MRELRFMDDKSLLRINSLLKHIDEVLEDTENTTVDDFKESRLLLKSTCFSLSQIGEQMGKLEELLLENYPDLPWKRARGMRNFIIHDYERIDIEQVYSTVKNDLPSLKEAFEILRRGMLS